MAEPVKDPADKKPLEAGTEGAADKKLEGAATREGEVDWKDLLRIEREGREAAERENDSRKQGIARLEAENKRLRGAARESGEEAPIGDQVKEAVQEAIAPVLAETKIEGILSTLVTDPTKREYVKDIYNHRIQKTGTSDAAIRADLETALDLADSKKTKKENEELKRMQESNGTYVPPAGGGSGEGGERGRIVAKAHQWTPEQESALERRAQSLGIDAEKYKERAWKEFQGGTAFAVKPRPKS